MVDHQKSMQTQNFGFHPSQATDSHLTMIHIPHVWNEDGEIPSPHEIQFKLEYETIQCA